MMSKSLMILKENVKLNWVIITIIVSPLIILFLLKLFGKIDSLHFLNEKIIVADLIIYLLIFSLVLFFYWRFVLFYYLDKYGKKKLDFDEKINLSNNKAFVLFGLVFGLFCITVFLLHWNNEKRRFHIERNEELSNKSKLLVTKFRYVEHQSFFNQNFSEVDLSLSIFHKILLINNDVRPNNLYIQYDKNTLEFDSEDNFNELFDKTKNHFDAILTGDISKENDEYRINNCLILTSDRYRSLLDLFYVNINSDIPCDLSKIEASNYFADPMKYTEYLLKTFIRDTSFSTYANSRIDFSFNLHNLFPSGLSFSATIEKSPIIAYNYLEFFRLWDKYKSIENCHQCGHHKKCKRYLSNSENILKLMLNSIDKVLSKLESWDEGEINFETTLLLLKAYVYSNLFNDFPENRDYYYNKIDFLYLCAQNNLEYLGFDDIYINRFKCIYYIAVYSSNNDFKNNMLKLRSQKISEIRKIVYSFDKEMNNLKGFKLSTYYERMHGI